MAERRIALIIGNSEYDDTSLARLVTPDADVGVLAEVLKSPDIGGFDEVTTLANQPGTVVRRAIAHFFAGKKRDDLLVLYFSGHGVLDVHGRLYLAVKDTERGLLTGTAIRAAFVTDEMDRSHSRRQVLVLDCCHSGAFARGAKGAIGASVGTAAAFEGTGYGRVVLTASDSAQYAWEGDEVIGQADKSVFTHYLIEGLKTGDADADGDGRITLDELYDYVYEQAVSRTPKQTPAKWSYKQQGEIIIARNPRPVVQGVELPPELRQAIESPLASVREGVVRELERFLRGSHAGLALAAHDALKRLAEDDSRRVATAATTVLAAHAEAQRAGWMGYTIGRRYKIEGLLGQGGMSTVYKASDPNLQRIVAIKLIHPHLSSDPEFVRRFEREAASVAQLRHPNIVQVFDFDHEGDVYYMVLEYMAGETLQAKLKALRADNQQLPLAETIRIMATTCDAVAYAHQHEVIHRDLKPANVMLDPQGQPILMDFGVAKMLGGQQLTATGAIVGTLAYMSPQQVRGEHLDGRADIYSLGVMLYEMTAGHPPFEADSASALMLKHLYEAVPDIRKMRSDAPDTLAAAINKALAKNPADRFQTAAEMAAALRAIDLARIERERLANERAEAERIAKQKAEQERLVRERAEQERLAKEKAEKERLARDAERAEAERIARQKAEEERRARERAEQERLAKEKAEAERLARQKAEEERLARERAEQERLAKEKAEKERIARQKAEEERRARERAEQERLAKERAEAERLARQRAEEERLARERAEQERLAEEKAEAERLARQKAEAERIARQKAAEERLARARAEAEHLARQRAEQERLARERAEQQRRARAAERARLKEQLRALLSNRTVLLIVAGAMVLGLGLLVVVPGLIPQLPPAEGMERVEGGRYTVGHHELSDNYVPLQEVDLSTFWLDQYEVTNAQYAKFVDETNAQRPTSWVNGNPPAGKDNYPVEGVTWDQAFSYCAWARKRLPTEAEWEVAARGRDGRLYPWGDKKDDVALPPRGTYPVGSITKNVSYFGVYDMYGNVWEWVANPYAQVETGHQVMRGGSHGNLRDMAYRLSGDPTVPTMFFNAGIRCAADQVEES